MKFFAQIDLQKRIKPLYNEDYRQFMKLKADTTYQFEVVRRRNPLFHNKAFALFNLGFENQEQINSFDHYRKVVTMKAGFYDTIITDKGTIYLPRSLSFGSMGEDEFEECYSAVLDVIAKQLDTAPDDIRREVEGFM